MTTFTPGAVGSGSTSATERTPMPCAAPPPTPGIDGVAQVRGRIEQRAREHALPPQTDLDELHPALERGAADQQSS